MEEAEYWLSHVERYGARVEGEKRERSPVIVALNKWESPGPYDVEQRRPQRGKGSVRLFSYLLKTSKPLIYSWGIYLEEIMVSGGAVHIVAGTKELNSRTDPFFAGPNGI